jgi:hypothetical protein
MPSAKTLQKGAPEWLKGLRHYLKVAQVLTAREAARKENTMGEKHYVYSARTTEKWLALLNKTRGERSWDGFINEAVCEHYRLDPAVISLPQSKFLMEREEKRKVKEAEKAEKKSAKKKGGKANHGKKTNEESTISVGV